MDKDFTLEKEFHEILNGGNYDRLDSFKEKKRWASMTPKERKLLGILFAAQGEHQLKKGDSKALESLDLALKVAPNDPMVLYRQAAAFSTQAHNVRCLTAACRALQAAVSIDPKFSEAWYGWGCALVRMGMFHGEASYFNEAHQKFIAAQECAQGLDQAKMTDLHWHWGLCWYYLGTLSGEAFDFRSALGQFRQAVEQGGDLNAVFWNDYGKSLIELALLIGRQELFLEAIDIFRNAIKLAPDYFDGWFHLACSCQRIFEYTKTDVYFNCANDCFSKAAELNSEQMGLWLNWGLLYLDSGKYKGEVEHLHLACDKFMRADACEHNHPLIIKRWSEAQMLFGAYSERLDLLKEAEEKITCSLEICSDDAEAWGIYGSCLNELGRYFEDESFYEQAAEKFRYGISLSPNNALLWYGLSLAHFALGEYRQDVQLIEQSVAFCAKVIECGGQGFPQFWNDWGVALMQLAEMTNEQTYVEQAIEKFELVLGRLTEGAEKPTYNLEWLYNYGCALDFLGGFTEDSQDHEQAIQILTQVIEQDPTYIHARYNLAMSWAHLGTLTDEIDCFHKALDHFQMLVGQDSEDEMIWNDWGVALINLAQLLHDPMHSEENQKLYEQAEEKLIHAVALGSTQAFYNLACLYALMNNYGTSMHYLERAEIAGSLPSLEDLLHDEWLEGLRQTAEFRNFISLLSKKYEKEK
jgi:tetratricopeptide (TPR) repeat protein